MPASDSSGRQTAKVEEEIAREEIAGSQEQSCCQLMTPQFEELGPLLQELFRVYVDLHGFHFYAVVGGCGLALF